MGLSVNFAVSGLDEVISNLKDIASKVTDFQSSEARTIANDMVDQMQGICPVDTGYMRDHITAEDDGSGRATVTSEADYSIYVEFGTRYMSAQPFFFPVVDQFSVQDIIDDFQMSIGL